MFVTLLVNGYSLVFKEHTANRIHKDEAFLFNIKSSIKFVSTSSPETLREIFSRSDEDEVVA